MVLESLAFGSKQKIPAKYTCDGDNLSPPLDIRDIPGEAKSLAVIVEDLDSPGGRFVHCVAYDLPPATAFPEGSLPGRKGLNDFGELGYGGPCPGRGAHRYVFHAYALDGTLDLPDGASRREVERAMAGRILDQAELTGIYARAH